MAEKRKYGYKVLTILAAIIVAAAVTYPCTYITPRKKIIVIDGKTDKPLAGVYVRYNQGYTPTANEFVNTSSCQEFTRCGITDENGEVVFSKSPFFQDSGCMPSNSSFLYFKPGYYYKVPWELKVGDKSPEKTIYMNPYDKNYDPCTEWDSHLAYFFTTYARAENVSGCAEMARALKRKEAELPGQVCRLFGRDLIDASEKGDLDKVRSILEKHPELLEYQYLAFYGTTGGTPLILSIKNKHWDLTEYLLSLGADVNARDWSGAMALHYALRNSDWDLAKELIVKGADVNARDEEGVTPLHLAVQGDDIELFKLLLEKGADPDAVDERGDTVLHKVLRSPEMAQALLDHGASIKIRNNCSQTPLLKLAEQGASNEILALLLKAGSEIDEDNGDGDTPLHYAALRCHLGTVKFLVDNGANVNAKNIMKLSPCDRATRCREVRDYLVSKGCVLRPK